MSRKYAGPLQEGRRSAKAGDGTPQRWSTVDFRECTENGCTADLCKCQPCPVCQERVPEWVLHVNRQTLKNSAWVGPHCIRCDFRLFVDGTHGDCGAPGR